MNLDSSSNTLPRRMPKYSLGKIISLFVPAYLIYQIAVTVRGITQFSHSDVFQNQTLSEVANISTVVRPLIDENQSFDIAVTVWRRMTSTERDQLKANDSLELSKEVPVYFGFPFQGLRLNQRTAFKDIMFEIPTDIFRNAEIFENAVRASFVLIPSSPSLLDHMSSFSQWIPSEVHVRPLLPSSFSSSINYRPDQLQALESFGVSIPLLRFPVIGRCEYDDDSNDDDNDVYPTKKWGPGRHPFIITRTQLRIVNETRLYNRKEYDKHHRKCLEISRKSFINDRRSPDEAVYLRLYGLCGNWATRLQLNVPEDDGLTEEFAYLPYFNTYGGAVGPNDSVVIPITRNDTKCPDIKLERITDKPTMNVTYRIGFLSASSGLVYTSEMFSGLFYGKDQPFEVDDHQKHSKHDAHELMSGLFGHQESQDAHPRWRAGVRAILNILWLGVSVQNINYWYTRTSTNGLSISGTALVVLAELWNAFTSAVDMINHNNTSVTSWIWLFIRSCFLPLLMLRTILRVDFAFKKMLPIPVRAAPTHLERTSERMDSRISWRIRIGILGASLAFFFFAAPHESFIVPSLAALPNLTALNRYARMAQTSITLGGHIFQIILNYQLRTFAGCYRSTTVLQFLARVFGLAAFVPYIVGHYGTRKGLPVHDVVEIVIETAVLWQATTLSRVKKEGEDEGVE